MGFVAVVHVVKRMEGHLLSMVGGAILRDLSSVSADSMVGIMAPWEK